jgi:hypothetical protein
MDRREELRAADADREVVAQRLREAVDEGRLDLYEYDERLGRAYTAKTYGELDQLLADLPGPAPVQPAPDQPAPDQGAPRRLVGPWLAAHWSGWANVVTVCVAIWLVTVVASGELTYFWPVWVAGPWGAVLLARTAGGLVSGEPHRWAERRERRGAGPGGAGPPAVAAAATPAAAGPAGAAAHRPVPRRGCR